MLNHISGRSSRHDSCWGGLSAAVPPASMNFSEGELIFKPPAHNLLSQNRFTGRDYLQDEHPWALLFRESNSVWRFFMNSTKKRWGLAASVANMSSKALLDFAWVGEGAIEPPFGSALEGKAPFSSLFLSFLGQNFAWTWGDWCICN